jgi:hypothetical protein
MKAPRLVAMVGDPKTIRISFRTFDFNPVELFINENVAGNSIIPASPVWPICYGKILRTFEK